MKNLTGAVAIVGACLSCAAVAAQQPYPTKPIRLVVGFAPGGSTDVTARIIAERFSAAFGQQVVVDNRAGAGGNIGADVVAKSNADGYTVLMATTGVMAFNHYLYSKLPYSAEKDLAPVSQIGALPLILVVPASLQAKSVKELVTMAKSQPGKYSFGTSGVGGATHVSAELFKALAGIDIVHVPYKGSGQMMADLLTGQVQIAFDQISSSIAHVKSGRLRALGISTAKRSALLPDLPTIAEGGVSGYEATSWNGFAVRTGTSPAIIARLQQETRKAVSVPEVKDKMFGLGIEAIGSTSAEFAAHIRAERAKWIPLFKKIGIQPQ
ncbi:MAG: tripartite tricarboxylate transporter substrate binding protein [Betaproteobacteria bacterium]|nr:tripartite tricarboxylate transporter substrate binding protein [Betaproteobacteria bacterium]MDH5343077.1 tripartite tricarboxylate transporter substrate binding protein [Betaproteobacteria bacterium]